MIDGFSAADGFREGRLNQGQVQVPLVVKPPGNDGRLLQCRAYVPLGYAGCGGLFREHIPIDIAVAESSAQAFGQRLAAAECSPGNCDYGHDSTSFSTDDSIRGTPQDKQWYSVRIAHANLDWHAAGKRVRGAAQAGIVRAERH